MTNARPSDLLTAPVRAYLAALADDPSLAQHGTRAARMMLATPDGPAAAVDELRKPGSRVMLGHPGTGKTVLLRAAAAAIARHGLATGTPAIPLYIDLARARATDAVDELIGRALAALDTDAEWVRPTVLLLDHLDKAPDLLFMGGIEVFVLAGGEAGPGIVLACREADWPTWRGGFDDLPKVRLLPLAAEAVRAAMAETPRVPAAAAQGWLARDPELADAAGTPRVLAALLQVAGSEAPEAWRRVAVLDALLDAVLATEPTGRRGQFRSALADVAFSSLGSAQVAQIDTMAMALGVTRDDMIRCGAVVGRGANLEFTEPLLARHCAALALASRFQGDPGALVSRLAGMEPAARARLVAHVAQVAEDGDDFLVGLLAMPEGAAMVAECLEAPDAAEPDGPHGPAATVRRIVERLDGEASVRALAALGAALAARGLFAAADAVSGPGGARGDGVADLVGRAHQALAVGDAATALDHARAAAAIEPGLGVAQLHIGRALLMLDRADEAIAALERARSLSPDVGDVYAALAEAYRHRDRLEDALIAYREASALAPEDGALEAAVGEVLAELGDLDGASEALARAVAIDPKHFAWLDALGQVNDELGRADAALSALADAVDLCPEDRGLIRRLARALRRTGEPQAAASLLAQAIGAAGDDADLLAELGRAHLANGRIDDAVDALRAAVALDDVWPADHLALAQALLARSASDGPDAADAASAAVLAAETALALAPDSQHADGILGAARQRLRALALASTPHEEETQAEMAPTPDLAQVPAVADPDGGDHQAALHVARLYESGGDIEAAYRMVAGTAVTDAAAQRWAAELALRLERAADAVRHGRNVVAAAPLDAAAHSALAGALRATGETGAALEALREACRLAPIDADLHLERATLARRVGALDEARRAAAAALDIQPSRPELHGLAGDLALEADDRDAAREAYERAAEAEPSEARWLIRLADLDADEAPGRARRLLAALPDDPDALRRLAQLEARSGDWSTAAETWSRARAAGPDDLASRTAHAAALVRSGRVGEAIEVLEPAARAADVNTSGAAQAVLAEAYEAANRLRDALASWSAAAAAEVLDADGWLRYARLAARLNAMAEAIQAAHRAAVLRPDRPEPCQVLGDIYEARGLLESAVRAYRGAAALAPNDPAPRVRLARIERLLGRADSALAELDACLERHPAASEALGERGRVLLLLGRREEAVADLAAAVERLPDDAALLRVLAESVAHEEPGRAAELWQRLVRLDASDTTARHRLGKALLDGGDATAARIELTAAASGGDEPDVLRDLGACCLALDDLPSARVALEEARKLAPDDACTWALIGRLATREARWPEALDAWAEAVRLAPDGAGHAHGLGALRMARGDAAGAVEALRSAARLAPDNVEILMAAGGALAAVDDQAGAVTAYERVMALGAASDDAALGLARARLALGDAPGACAVLEPVLAAGTHSPEVLLALAEARVASGEPAEGLVLAERATQAAPTSANARRTLAAVRLANGDLTGARAAVAKALSLSPADPATLLLGAELAEMDGDPDAARHAWRQAVTAAPYDGATAIAWGERLAAEGWEIPLLSPLRPLIDAADAAVARPALERATGTVDGALAERAWRALAVLLGRSDDADGALRAARRAVDTLATAEGWLTLAWAAVGADEPEAALVAIDGARAAGRDDAVVHGLAASAHAALDDAPRAVAALRLACTRAPEAGALHVRLGEALAAAGRTADGLAVLEHAQCLPGGDEAARAIGRLALASGDVERALTELEDHAVNDPRDAESLRLLAEARRDGGDLPGAIEALERASKRMPERDAWHGALGELFRTVGDADSARARFERAHRLAPTVAAWPCALAEMALDDERPDEARRWLAEALRADPRAGRARALEGCLALAAGDAEGARDALTTAVAECPDDGRLHHYLGMAILATGDAEGAIEALENAARSGDATAETYVTLGRLYAEADSVDDALAAFADAVRLDPKRVGARIGLGQAYAAAGLPDRALEVLRQAIQAAPDDWRPVRALARVLDANGSHAAALEAFEHAIERSPERVNLYLEASAVAIRAHDHVGACALLDRAHALAPTHAVRSKLLSAHAIRCASKFIPARALRDVGARR